MTDGNTGLFQLQDQILGLNVAAQYCSVNYRYYHYHRMGAELPMLDCDFLWSALRLPHLATLRTTPQPDIAGLTAEVRSWTGPHTMRRLIRSLSHYAIPPGAMAELLRRKDRLLHDLSDGAHGVLHRFDGAQRTRAPLETIMSDGQPAKLAAALRNELATLDSLYDDTKLVARVVDNSQDIAKWLGAAPAQSNDSYLTSFNALGARPGRVNQDKNNFADAVNVALLVWLFYSPKEGSGKGPVPVLVTRTQAVADLQGWLPLPDPREIRLLQKPPYLLLSQALHGINEGDPLGVISDAKELARGCHEVLAYVPAALEACKNAPPGSTSCTELDQLRTHLGRFVNRWAEVIDLTTHYPALDQASYANALMTTEMKVLLEKLDVTERRGEGIEEILAAIRNNLDRNEAFRELLPEPESTEIGSAAADALTLTFVPPEKRTTLMRRQEPGLPFERPLTVGADKNVRLAVSLKDLRTIGPVLIADCSFEDEPELRATWLHGCDVERVASAAGLALRTLATSASIDSADAVVFAGEETRPVEARGLDPTFETRLRDACSAGHHLEVSIGDVALSFDIEPLMSEERQVTVTAPLASWSDSLVFVVAEMTGRLHSPVPRAFVRAAVRKIVAELRHARREA